VQQSPHLKPHARIYDEVVDQSLHIEADGKGMKIHSVTHQDVGPILEHNKTVMREGGSRTLSFGKSELVIPEVVLTRLKKKYPELQAPDMEIRVKAWKRFLASSESRPWRVSTKKYV